MPDTPAPVPPASSDATSRPTVLVTGSTGFVGSALAARLLAAGLQVLALSRNDPDGSRTRASIDDAARGFGLALGELAQPRLTVLPIEPGGFSQTLTRQRLADVTAAWHVAAEMSYASDKSLESYQTNVVATCELYRQLAEQAPNCRRFYYVSTAYTAGMAGGPVKEELHAGLPYSNAYQLSKSMAEHALASLQPRHRLPVTLFRPTIVVGHSQTGWTRRNGFGFYMFVEALSRLRRAGIARLSFAIDSTARPDLIPIDRLVDDAVALTRRDREGAPLEILHCAGGLDLSIAKALETIGAALGLELHFDGLHSATDRRVDRAIRLNRAFASTEWSFCRHHLAQAVDHARPPAVTAAELSRTVQWYLAVDETSAPETSAPETSAPEIGARPGSARETPMDEALLLPTPCALAPRLAEPFLTSPVSAAAAA